MVGISPWLETRYTGSGHGFRAKIDLAIWPVFRTFPIRVAGNSGPLKDELTWEQMAEITNGHAQPELTTVTQLVRRIGRWDADLARAAMRANGAPSKSIRPVLTFLDYLHPELANEQRLTNEAVDTIRQLEADIESSFHMVSTGPNTMIEI
jgi:adenylosuccinate synthase